MADDVRGAVVLLSFAPNLFIGFVYARQTRAVTLRRALVLGHLMIAWNYIGYAAAWRALFRIVLRRNNWTKTPRSQEEHDASPVTAGPEAALTLPLSRDRELA